MSVTGIESSLSGSLSEILTRIRGSGGQESDDDFASSFTEEKDSDGDGLLTLEEAGIDEEHFLSVDTDGDGFMSEDEIQADVDSRAEQMPPPMNNFGMFMEVDGESLTDKIIGQSDTDGDSMLSQEESGLSDELFAELDTDGDGLLSSSEIDAALQPPDMVMASAATSSSSSEESSESSSSSSDDEDYDEYDLNKDGVVSMDELRQAWINGDVSLDSLFAGGEEDKEVRSPLMRMGMQAYQAQDMGSMLGYSLGIA